MSQCPSAVVAPTRYLRDTKPAVICRTIRGRGTSECRKGYPSSRPSTGWFALPEGTAKSEDAILGTRQMQTTSCFLTRTAGRRSICIFRRWWWPPANALKRANFLATRARRAGHAVLISTSKLLKRRVRDGTIPRYPRGFGDTEIRWSIPLSTRACAPIKRRSWPRRFRRRVLRLPHKVRAMLPAAHPRLIPARRLPRLKNRSGQYPLHLQVTASRLLAPVQRPKSRG